jgi:hypothetical protein
MKIIFLDIDGVLNGYGPIIGLIYKIAKALHIVGWVRRIYDITGIHRKKLWILSRIINKTDALVVITSSWRGDWMLTENTEEQIFKQHKDFKEYMKHYQIPIIDVTPSINDDKGLEIREWLVYHPRITKYCVIDDDWTFLNQYFPNNAVCTAEIQSKKFTRGWHENTGLKMKHIKQVVKILNEENYYEKTY